MLKVLLLLSLTIFSLLYFFSSSPPASDPKLELAPVSASAPVQVSNSPRIPQPTPALAATVLPSPTSPVSASAPASAPAPASNSSPGSRPGPNSLDGSVTWHLTRINRHQGLVSGDILVDLPPPDPTQKHHNAYVHPRPKTWEAGVVPFVVHPDVEVKREIALAIRYMQAHTNIRFVRKNSEKDYIQFVKGRKNCYSYLGRLGGRQEIQLTSGCSTGQILHELLHALGLVHEHSRPDRDRYITIHWRNIPKEHWPQFQVVPESFLLVPAADFDFQSIMLYGPQTFAIDKKYFSISRKGENPGYRPLQEALSTGDLAKLARIY